MNNPLELLWMNWWLTISLGFSWMVVDILILPRWRTCTSAYANECMMSYSSHNALNRSNKCTCTVFNLIRFLNGYFTTTWVQVGILLFKYNAFSIWKRKHFYKPATLHTAVTLSPGRGAGSSSYRCSNYIFCHGNFISETPGLASVSVKVITVSDLNTNCSVLNW